MIGKRTSEETKSHSCSRTNLLLVEQNTHISEALCRVFLSRGYEVVRVTHPRQALEAATIHDFHTAVIDTKLPEIDGLRLSKKLMRLTADLIVILLCGDPEGPSRDEARASGAFDLVYLPCPVNAIEAVVAYAVSEGEQGTWLPAARPPATGTDHQSKSVASERKRTFSASNGSDSCVDKSNVEMCPQSKAGQGPI